MAIRQEEETPIEMQLTPLIDCVFLLLIFFLVSSQLKKVEKKIDLHLPQAHVVKSFKQTPEMVTVSVSARGDLFVNGRAVGPGGLLEALRKAKEDSPESRVILDGDVFAPFRSIVEALDACALAGLEVTGIHTAEHVPTHD